MPSPLQGCWKNLKNHTPKKKKKLSSGQMVDLKNGSLKNLMIYRQKQSYFKKRIFKITMSTTQIKSGNNVFSNSNIRWINLRKSKPWDLKGD